MVERLQVQSSSPFEIHHILTGLEKTPEINDESELFLPEGNYVTNQRVYPFTH
jgi:hypothetical protein